MEITKLLSKNDMEINPPASYPAAAAIIPQIEGVATGSVLGDLHNGGGSDGSEINKAIIMDTIDTKEGKQEGEKKESELIEQQPIVTPKSPSLSNTTPRRKGVARGYVNKKIDAKKKVKQADEDFKLALELHRYGDPIVELLQYMKEAG